MSYFDQRTIAAACLSAMSVASFPAGAYEAPKAKNAPVIDGLATEKAWDKAPWQAIDKVTIGSDLSPQDFQGRYKMVWTKNRLYLLAEIVDDVLADTHADPLDAYWDDDALELFIDEDKSGGNHQFSYNAFAYHIALDNQSIDIGPFETDDRSKVNFRAYNDHITSIWKRNAEKIIWEVEIVVYPDTYKDSYAKGETPVKPVELKEGKELGWMVSYCDADKSGAREHFIGDIDIPAVNGGKNRGFIDASVFGSLRLVK